MPTFGYTTTPGGHDTSGGSGLELASTTAASNAPLNDGTVSKVTGYLGNSNSSARTIGMAIWADSSGAPGSLLHDFGTHSIPGSTGAAYIDFTGSLAVTAGTTYWIGYYTAPSADGVTIGADAAAANSTKYKVGAGAPSNPFGTPSGSGASVYGLYATYTSTAPTNSVAPVASGSTTIGSTVSTTNGTWTENPTSFTYQWQRDVLGNGVYGNIATATSNTYVLTALDDSCNVRCVVTATNDGGSASSNSNSILATTPVPSGGQPGFRFGF